MVSYEQLIINKDNRLKTLKFWKVYSDGTFGLESEIPDPHFSTNDDHWILKANTNVSFEIF